MTKKRSKVAKGKVVKAKFVKAKTVKPKKTIPATGVNKKEGLTHGTADDTISNPLGIALP